MKVLAHIPEMPADAGSIDAPKLKVFDHADSLPFTLPKKNENVLSIVCIRGSLDLCYDSRCYTLRAHSIIVLLPGHLIESFVTSDDFNGFLITAAQKNFKTFLPLMSRLLICSMQYRDNPVISLTEDELHNQILLHDLLSSKLRDDSTMFDRLVIDKLVEASFCETINIYFKRLEVKSDALCNRGESLFYKFIVSVERHFMRERSVNFYAAQLCVSPKHLSSVVKDLTGNTAGDWIDSYVVTEIKRMLASSDLTIQEISTRMNFSNQSFFGKYFKAHTGMSPREYRTGLFKKG